MQVHFQRKGFCRCCCCFFFVLFVFFSFFFKHQIYCYMDLYRSVFTFCCRNFPIVLFCRSRVTADVQSGHNRMILFEIHCHTSRSRICVSNSSGSTWGWGWQARTHKLEVHWTWTFYLVANELIYFNKSIT